jgi:diaminopimelate epimerase
MKLNFKKYEATGNDFIMVDNRDGGHSLPVASIKKICDRHFGIGADGVILIENHPTLDFNLVYFNSDGSQSLCGNGSRAAVKMASSLGIVNGKASFQAFDGKHEAELLPSGIVKLRMNDVTGVRSIGDDLFLNTGSPHVIKWVENASDIDVIGDGRVIRYGQAFKPGGANVNFVELQSDNSIFVRTYERGVENETLSCGTGVTAAALAANLKGYSSPVHVKVIGGDLFVEFKTVEQVSDTSDGYHRQSVLFTDIFLIGPAKMVFEGTLEL